MSGRRYVDRGRGGTGMLMGGGRGGGGCQGTGMLIGGGRGGEGTGMLIGGGREGGMPGYRYVDGGRGRDASVQVC